MSKNIDFNSFVSGLVGYYLKQNNDMSINWLSEQTGLSVSFIQKAIYTPKEKHFNLRHIFLIANAMKISYNELLPSRDNYKLICGEDISAKEWNEYISTIRNGEE